MDDVRSTHRHPDTVAHRRDRRHRDHRLPRELALSPVLEGGLVRSHRVPRRESGDRRRCLRAADHPRHHPGQHERPSDGGHPRERRRADHQGSHAGRHMGRVLRAGGADQAGGVGCRRDARPAHHGAGPAARAALRQVHLGVALGRLRGDHVRNARAARRLRHPRQGRRRRGARPERPGARIRRHHRSRPDRPAILQSVEPLRRRRPDPADRGDRGPAQAAQRHRAGFDDPHPHPQPRSREAGARHRARE